MLVKTDWGWFFVGTGRDTERVSALPYPTKVQRMVRTCGIRMTALYLKNRGYTPEQAVTLMFR